MRILAQISPDTLIVDSLEDVHYTTVDDETVRSIEGEEFAAIVLEHPLSNGLLGKIATQKPHIPIIVVVPFNEPVLVEQYLSRGAYSYAIPGMSINGIRLLIRSTLDVAPRSIAFGSMLLTGRQLKVGDKSIKLTEREAEMMRQLIVSPGHWISRADLLSTSGYKPNANTHTVETHIYRLRKKLGEFGLADIIESERGGYLLRRR